MVCGILYYYLNSQYLTLDWINIVFSINISRYTWRYIIICDQINIYIIYFSNSIFLTSNIIFISSFLYKCKVKILAKHRSKTNRIFYNSELFINILLFFRLIRFSYFYRNKVYIIAIVKLNRYLTLNIFIFNSSMWV